MRRSLLVTLSSILLALPAAAGDGTGALLVGPRKIFPGSAASVTVHAYNGADGQPRSVSFEIRLAPAQGEAVVLGSGKTDGGGWANLLLEVPRDQSGGLYRLTAQVAGVDDAIAIPIEVVESPVLLLETDKPIYKPGQVIQGRVLLLNSALRPLTGKVEVEIRDAKQNKVYRRELSTNSFGAAAFELPLAEELNAGDWKLLARSGETKADSQVRVEPYLLPRFRLEVVPDRDWFLFGEPITGSVRSSYFFGKPVDGEVTVVARRLSEGEWIEYARHTAPVSAGAGRFEVGAFGEPPQSGGAAVTLEVILTDSTGHAEKTQQLVSLTDSPFQLKLVSRSPSAKPGLPFHLGVESTDPAGRPISLPVEVTLFANDDNGQVVGRNSQSVLTQGGRATLSFTVPASAQYLVLEARSDDGPFHATARIYGPLAYSPSASYLQLLRGGSGPLAVGEAADFQVVSNRPGATFYEVVAGGRTVLSGALPAGADRIRFAASPLMAPEAKLVVYRVFAQELGTDSQSFPVRPSAGVELAVDFDAREVRPGDPVKVQISAGVPSLVGLAIVDESVLALSRNRLDVASVYREVAARFGGPSDAELQLEFADRPHTVGARDVLGACGLAAAVSGGDSGTLQVPEGYNFWPGSYQNAGGYTLPRLDPAGAPLAEVGRVRRFFPETWVWEPLLLTDTAGRATLELTAPDSITNWKLRAVSTSNAGLGLAAGDLVVFQEFFVEPDLPYAVTRGEELWLPVAVYNYLDAAQKVELSLEPNEGFEILGPPSVQVETAPNSVAAASFPIRAKGLGTFPFQLTARGPLKADAVVRTLRVEPEGSPQESVVNHALPAGGRVSLDASFGQGTVAGSEKLVLSITGSQVAQTLNGVADLCGRPYGCGEQNMIFTSVDVEALRYLRARGVIEPEVERTLRENIALGYQRELTYQHPDGWFNAFVGPNDIGSLWLTAYCLSVFSQARELTTIDDDVLSAAANWMAGHQQADGGWKPVGFVIHQELLGGLSGDYALTAFVALALDRYRGLAGSSLERAKKYLETRLSDAKDGHSLAMGAFALVSLGSSVAGQALDRLESLAQVDPDRSQHWEPVPVETTAYAVLAFHRAGRTLAASAGAAWLAAQKNSRGGFGNTQDTVMALRGLVEDALAATENTDIEVTVERGGEVLHTLRVDRSNADVLQSFAFVPGPDLSVSTRGKGPVAVQFAKLYHVPTESLHSRGGLELDVRYDRGRLAVGDAVGAEVRLAYRGERPQTGMALAEIGIPTGLRPDREALARLVGRDRIQRVEVSRRSIAIYFDELVAGESVTLPLTFIAAYPAQAVAAPSKAYDYYDPSIEAVDAGRPLVVGERDAELAFLRGDTNADGRVNLADVIGGLEALFTGQGPIACEDALDVNDDGGANIADPIALLFYLFAGGTPPAEPFPRLGADRTEDGLHCRAD